MWSLTFSCIPSVVVIALGGNGLCDPKVCLFTNSCSIMFAIGGCNFWLLGFLDMWLVLFLIPVSVALTVTIFLNADAISNNLVLILPNFEVV